MLVKFLMVFYQKGWIEIQCALGCLLLINKGRLNPKQCTKANLDSAFKLQQTNLRLSVVNFQKLSERFLVGTYTLPKYNMKISTHQPELT